MSNRLNNPKFLVGHWPLNGNANDTIGRYNGTVTGMTYAESQFNRKSLSIKSN